MATSPAAHRRPHAGRQGNQIMFAAGYRACCVSERSFGTALKSKHQTTSMTLALTIQSFRAIRFCQSLTDKSHCSGNVS